MNFISVKAAEEETKLVNLDNVTLIIPDGEKTQIFFCGSEDDYTFAHESYEEVCEKLARAGVIVQSKDEEIVRCEECKHGWKNTIDGFIYCHRDGRRVCEMLFESDSFCSYGERKDGAE